MSLPEYLKQGEVARLFPVLSETSKEGRTTSIVLACMTAVRELGSEMMSSLGQRVGSRTTMQAYTEIVMKDQKVQLKDRPDGLVVLSNGSKEWRVLVEAKIGTAILDPEQVERYRQIAKEHGLDGVVTISNQFATTPTSHPVEDIRRSRSKIPVYHWSWMSILTKVDLLLNNGSVSNSHQRLLLNELRRFLTHDSAGLRGFDRMPPEWTELNKLVTASGRISSKSKEALAVLAAPSVPIRVRHLTG